MTKHDQRRSVVSGFECVHDVSTTIVTFSRIIVVRMNPTVFLPKKFRTLSIERNHCGGLLCQESHLTRID